jgi:hypothetical protein
MTQTHATQCFEIDLEEHWVKLDPLDVDAHFNLQDAFEFYNEAIDTKLFISGDLINATGRDLLDLATRMNSHVLTAIATACQHLSGILRSDENMIAAATPSGFEADITAEVLGPPEVRQRMLVVAIINPVVAIYARLESRHLDGAALRNLWRELRPGLFLAEAV